jgi:hypothetical protein
MNIDAKILNNIMAKGIKNTSERSSNHDQLGFFPQMHS